MSTAYKPNLGDAKLWDSFLLAAGESLGSLLASRREDRQQSSIYGVRPSRVNNRLWCNGNFNQSRPHPTRFLIGEHQGRLQLFYLRESLLPTDLPSESPLEEN